MSLSFRQMETVYAVARHGSVTGAASALGVSQPAVSMALRSCTEAAGFPLFIRRRGRLQATSETLALLTGLERVFDGLERVNRLVDDTREGFAGTIDIAATPTLADNMLPEAVARFQEARPNIRIAVHTMDNSSVVERVRQERVDFGLTLTPLSQFEGRTIDLCTTQLICAVHPTHPLVGRRFVGPRDLKNFPLISFSRDLPLGALVEQSFQAAGIHRKISIEVTQSSVACALARAGAGVAIIDPFWLSGGLNVGIASLHLRPSVDVKAQALSANSRPLSRPAQHFLRTLREIARNANFPVAEEQRGRGAGRKPVSAE